MTMSIAGILSSALFGAGISTAQSNAQKLKTEFQQLGQDLQSGNLSAAKSDIATLQQNGAQSNSHTPGQSNNLFAQQLNQLSQDLQSGNLSAAQQDYSTIAQGLQSPAAQNRLHHHHHAGGNSSGQSQIGQLFAQLGQSLQSGNLTAAQQAYTTLQNDFTQFAQTNGLPAPTSILPPSRSGSVSVNA
jgi:soluble cytochrome b562